jgi:hypothetical protein
LIPDAILIASYTLGHTGPIGRREHERSPKDVNLSHLWTHRSFSLYLFVRRVQGCRKELILERTVISYMNLRK